MKRNILIVSALALALAGSPLGLVGSAAAKGHSSGHAAASHGKSGPHKGGSAAHGSASSHAGSGSHGGGRESGGRDGSGGPNPIDTARSMIGLFTGAFGR